MFGLGIGEESLARRLGGVGNHRVWWVELGDDRDSRVLQWTSWSRDLGFVFFFFDNLGFVYVLQ